MLDTRKRPQRFGDRLIAEPCRTCRRRCGRRVLAVVPPWDERLGRQPGVECLVDALVQSGDVTHELGEVGAEHGEHDTGCGRGHRRGATAGPEGAGALTTRIDRLAEESSRWLGFRGTWGELQYFHAPGIGTVPFGTAPVGPALHAVWSDPLGTMAGWNA